MKTLDNMMEKNRSSTLEAGTAEARKVIINGLYAVAATILMALVGGTVASTMGLTLGLWGVIGVFVVMFGLIFAISAYSHTKLGLPLLLLFGATHGLILVGYVSLFTTQMLAIAVVGTLVVVGGCMWVAMTQKSVDSSNWGGYLLVLLVAALVGLIANIFIGSTLLSGALSVGIIVLMGAFVIYDTQDAIRNPHRGYVEFALGMYLNIINIFIHLLNLLGMSWDD